MAFTLAASEPEQPPIPAGQITLRYLGATDSTASFSLENGTSNTIYVHGKRSLWREAIPYDTEMVCRSVNNSLSEVQPFPHRGDASSIIEVPAVDRLRIGISWNHDAFFSASSR
jgi:hypothetical protein